MIQRTTNPNHRNWMYYGGRGITADLRWHIFENFLEDMGLRPEGLTLERIDNDKGYSLGNCKWATWAEQQANKRKNGAPRREQCIYGHPLIPENLYYYPSGKRACRTCRAERGHARYV